MTDTKKSAKTLAERAAARATALKDKEEKLRNQLADAEAAKKYVTEIQEKTAAIQELQQKINEVNKLIKRPRGPNKPKSAQL